MKKSAAKKTAKKPTAKKAALKRGPGRPPRADGAATSGIYVRLTSDERSALESLAQHAGETLSAYARRILITHNKTS